MSMVVWAITYNGQMVVLYSHIYNHSSSVLISCQRLRCEPLNILKPNSHNLDISCKSINHDQLKYFTGNTRRMAESILHCRRNIFSWCCGVHYLCKWWGTIVEQPTKSLCSRCYLQRSHWRQNKLRCPRTTVWG